MWRTQIQEESGDNPSEQFYDANQEFVQIHQQHISNGNNDKLNGTNSVESKNSSGRTRGALVRHNRSRLNPNDPHYYYSQHAMASNTIQVAPSTTGNDPLVSYEPGGTSAVHLGSTAAIAVNSFLADDFSNGSSMRPLPVTVPTAIMEHSRDSNTQGTETIGYSDKLTTPTAQLSTIGEPNSSQTSSNGTLVETSIFPSAWRLFCKLITLPVIPPILTLCGIKGKKRQHAWREKVGLLSVIGMITLVVGFFTFGFDAMLCGTPVPRVHISQVRPDTMIVHGMLYNISDFRHDDPNHKVVGPKLLETMPSIGGSDASLLFQNVNSQCTQFLIPTENSTIPHDQYNRYPFYFPCAPVSLITGQHIPNRDVYSTLGHHSPLPDSSMVPAFNLNSLNMGNSSELNNIPQMTDFGYGCHLSKDSRDIFYAMKPIGDIYYTWEDIRDPSKRLISFMGVVLDLGRLDLLEGSNWELKYPLSNFLSEVGRRDYSYELGANKLMVKCAHCLVEIAKVGVVDSETVGCITSHTVLIMSLVFVGSIVSVKFIFALYFGWFLSWHMGINNHTSTGATMSDLFSDVPTKAANHKPSDHDETFQMVLKELVKYLICLVTVYNESESELRKSLDSIVESHYPNSHKLLMVICDGRIKRKDGTGYTSDMVLSMLECLEPPELAKDLTYVAIGKGPKRLNIAKVYYGYYSPDDNRFPDIDDNISEDDLTRLDPPPQPASKRRKVPMVCIVKHGLPGEDSGTSGNRGKRDSQIILMRFLQRVMFGERMNDLEHEMYWSILQAAKVSPTKYEALLMVDADTKIHPDSLRHMVTCLAKDNYIMGLCGETMIQNKHESWVTMIQVFEYFISHHLTKSFESVFGGVTCLPGCFCMYRIKARKGDTGYMVPLLANPDIVERYAVCNVETLHHKNLLLLGEDRYLSTLMLRVFPRRKQVFVPQAKCTTLVPAHFKDLLHQRRRWINSTIHNLMELVLVRNLCGVFCISMQFVVMVELIGTLTLPAALVFTLYLAITSIYRQSVPVIPFVLLGFILGTPAVLIIITAHQWIYVIWMLIYLCSLPVWNFILPLYAFWKFDDFSWTSASNEIGNDMEGEASRIKMGSVQLKMMDTKEFLTRRTRLWEIQRRQNTKSLPEWSISG